MASHDLTTREGVLALMRSSTSDDEWNANALAVKRANGGNYPDFWFAEIMQSRLYDKVVGAWRYRPGPITQA